MLNEIAPECKRLVLREDSESYGRDPREIGREGLMDLGFEGQPLLKVIRDKCLDCCCQQPSEVRKCVSIDCPLWAYRMGSNPFSNRKGNAEALRRARGGENS